MEFISSNGPTPSDPPFGSDSHSIQAILTADDPIAASRLVLAELSRSLYPSILAVYRVVPGESPDQRPVLSIYDDLTPESPLVSDPDLFGSNALERWNEQLFAGESVLAPVAELPTAAQRRLEDHGSRSFIASPILIGRELVAVLVCTSEREMTDWPVEHRLHCERASEAVGVALLRQRANAFDRLTSVLKYAFDIIAVVGPDGTIVSHTPTFARLMGNMNVNLAGQSAFDSIHPDDRQRVSEAFARLRGKPNGQRRIELRLKNVDGEWRHFEALGTNQIDNPLIGGIVVTAYDVTDRKHLEERLNWQALHDPLTNLANRSLLMNDLRHALARAQRGGGKVGLLYVDLDRFKEVNDHFGHPAGDQLLIEIGVRLQTCVRASETVARLGGDEFVVLLEGLETDLDVDRAATRFLEAIHVPVRLSQGMVNITASMGIAMATSETIDPDDLLIRADTALYEAKRAGRARYQRFSRLRPGEDTSIAPSLNLL